MKVLVKYYPKPGVVGRAVIEAPSTWAALDIILAITKADHATARKLAA